MAVVAVSRTMRRPTVIYAHSTRRKHIHETIKSNKNVLEIEGKYVVYRALLYCDDFNVANHLFPKGTVGGFYMISLDLPLYRCKKLSSIRIICPSPPGISTNQFLSLLISDRIKKTVEGIEGLGYKGNFLWKCLGVPVFLGGLSCIIAGH